MKVAIIGTGNVGRALGAGWHRSGHTIRFGVRNPQDPKHQVVTDEAQATVHTVKDAAADADVIVLAVHWESIDDVLSQTGDLSGRTVIDATNPLAFSEAGMSLAFGFTTSAGEEIAAKLPHAKIVKTLNHVGAGIMETAHRYKRKPVMFVASDHGDAKETATRLVGDLGFDAQDGGPLKTARLLEPLAMLWIEQVYARGAAPESAFSFAADLK